MAEGKNVRNIGIDRQKATATISPGEVVQGPTGLAGVFDESVAVASDSYFELQTAGSWTLKKTTGFVAIKGGRAYWDHSANSVTYKRNNDRDFYVGRFAEDALTTDSTCVVALNANPPYDVDLIRDGYQSTLVGTAAAGGFGYPVRLGGAQVFEITGTTEAQKVDALSVDGFALDSNAVVEGAFRILSDGSGTNTDVSLGIANATHTSDADSITEAMFIHLDGNDANIYAESDDGTVEVAATDTTINYTEGATLSSRVEFWMDARAPADVQLYINGSNVLAATVFDISLAAGPFFLLAHVEKASSSDTYKLALDWLRVRFVEH